MTHHTTLPDCGCAECAALRFGGEPSASMRLANADAARRDLAASILEPRYPKIAAMIRAGMRSSNWPENLVDPGLLLDLLEKVEATQWHCNICGGTVDLTNATKPTVHVGQGGR